MLRQALQYFDYRLKAKGADSIHSPFVFELQQFVLNDDRDYYWFDEIEDLRLDLLDDFSTLKVLDHGAGSHRLKDEDRRIAHITRVSCVKPKYGRLLFRLAVFLKAQSILELGTCLGLGTAYLASADQRAIVTSLEGASSLAKMASVNLDELGLKANVVCGRFDDLLPDVKESFDIIYVDGNHTYEATKGYFLTLINQLNEGGVMIMDDIYWSEGMTRAWKEIREDPRVKLSIDVHQFGMLFKREGIEKQHFVLKY
jgi:predicted O-methyltransferase YrrM